MIDFGQLLYSGYEYGRLKLDLYGQRATPDEGHVVTTVTLVGKKVSVTYLLDDEALDEMGLWLDVEKRVQYDEARREANAERIAYDMLAAKYDHQWRSF
jgi:hypothetical protein